MDSMKGKNWPELCLDVFKEMEDRREKLEQLSQELDELNHAIGFGTDELEEYISSLKDNINIPLWNQYPKHKPDDLKVHAESYFIYMEEEGEMALTHFFEAKYENNKFYIFSFKSDGGVDWIEASNVKYWIPITYPEPY